MNIHGEKIPHLQRILCLLAGLCIASLGIVTILKAEIGVQPWDVFHQGIANATGLSFGTVNILVGYIILVLNLFIKIIPGPGTIVNIIVIGSVIDKLLPIIPSSNSFVMGLAMNVVGAIIMALGSALYIKATYGAGARDSTVMGLVHKFQLNTKFVKPSIEAIVLIIGIILGGNFGIGTFISLFLVGYFIDVFFKLIGYNPKKVTQLTFVDVLKDIKDKRVITQE